MSQALMHLGWLSSWQPMLVAAVHTVRQAELVNYSAFYFGVPYIFTADLTCMVRCAGRTSLVELQT